MKKKIPWGVFCWICAEIVFFLTLGVVVAFVILNAVAGATSGGITLFTNWWQTLLFVADLIFLCLLAVCFAMFVRRKIITRKGKEEKR